MKAPFVEVTATTRTVLFFGGNVLVGSGLFFHAFLYNFYLTALGMDESVMGFAAASLTVGGLLALLPAGRMVDRFGIRTTLVTATLCTSVGLGAGAVAERAVWIYAAGLLAGAGAVSWRISMAPFIMQWTTGGQRSRVFSWNVALLVGSGALWMIIGGWAADVLQDDHALAAVTAQRATLLVGAALSLLAIPFFGVAAGGRKVKAASPCGSAAVPEDGPVSLAPLAVSVACVALWMTAPALVMPFFNVFFFRVHELSISHVGAVFGLAHLGTAVVLVGSGELAGRIGPRRLLAVWTAAFPPMLWLLAVTSGVEVAIGLYFLQGLVSPAANPLIDEALLVRVPAGRHGTVSSWRNAATEIAGIIGAGVGGRLLRDTSFDHLFVAAGVVGAFAAVLLLAALRRGHRT